MFWYLNNKLTKTSSFFSVAMFLISLMTRNLQIEDVITHTLVRVIARFGEDDFGAMVRW